jgi:D-beta-D-heptose 7-phosphate kinase / D-beta-D-heptose 1-phosphate adenosyltransferase
MANGMKNTAQYLQLINGFRRRHVLVIGDLLLDVYLKGISTRLCPEAPVPVVDVHEKTVHLGGAANTVCNLKSLGASVSFATVIGSDAEGDEALRLLNEFDIDQSNVIRDPARSTITKSRVVAGRQVITRIDQGSEDCVSKNISQLLMEHIEKCYEQCDAIVISDYGKGVITEVLMEELIRLQQRHQKFISVDSKRLAFFSGLYPAHAKPNYDEAIKLLHLPALSSGRVRQLTEHSDALYKQTNASIITLTLDAEGSVLIENGKVVEIISAPPVEKPQVAGAGDSYLSAFVLAWLNSRNHKLSVEIASATAEIVIKKDCTSTCSQTELKGYFNINSKYIENHEDLRGLCATYRAAGKRIVFTNGCFDILHSGHVTYLQCAKELGDILIVGLNSDDSIKRIKGKNRPINSLSDRLQVLAGLSAVDHIVPFGDKDDDTPVPLIRIVKPDVFAKGGDYSKDKLPEAGTVEGYGGEIVFLDHVPERSTTRIINRISQVGKRISDFQYE